MSMRGYGRDEHENLDEYEEEDEEEGEEQVEDVGEEEEEKARLSTQEALDYLELRQRLKESYRKQMKKDSGYALSNSREKKSKLSYDNYGSFFGPSQPVIAQRVIQESKSLLENPHLASMVSKANNGRNKDFASTPVAIKPRANDHPPEVTSRVNSKTKIQLLKNTRDYSFLLSDDTELPALTKDPPPRSISTSKTEAKLAQRTPSNTGRISLNCREEKKPMPPVNQMRAKLGPQKASSASKTNSTSVESRKRCGSNNGIGPGRPSGVKCLPSKISMPSKGKVFSAQGAESSVPGVRKPFPSKLQSSVPKQPLEQKKEYREINKGKIVPKQPMLSSKPQIKQQPAKVLTRATVQEERPKKRPVRQYSDDEDDGGAAISMIRSMFGYNPNKYRDDDDDSDMEANFEDIMKEERRSAKIAKKEDEEELRKIEEEERREQMRAKKRKLSR